MAGRRSLSARAGGTTGTTTREGWAAHAAGAALALGAPLGLITLLLLLLPAIAAAQTFPFANTEQVYVVPAGVTVVTITAKGADGDGTVGSPGGHGGIVNAQLQVTPGESLFVEVGGAGQGGQNGPGGANGGGGGGNRGPDSAFGAGGASDVRLFSCESDPTLGCPSDSVSLNSRVLVAGGGGGAGIADGGVSGAGGDAGQPGGVPTGAPADSAGGAGAQTQVFNAGFGCTSGSSGAAGSGSIGGTGGGVTHMGLLGSGGGGGGGGYFGGGGGGACLSNGSVSAYASGGGGGSDFAGPGAFDESTAVDTTTDADGSVTIVPAVPSVSSGPTITGSDVIGQTLTEAHAPWTNAPTGFSYQWLRCAPAGNTCGSISGATSQTYLLTPLDLGSTLRVQETAADQTGSSAPATSAPTGVIGAVPSATDVPGISGSPNQGQLLSESRATWTNNPTSFAYQWLRCDAAGDSCTSIDGATGQLYRLTSADRHHTIRAQETASNQYGAGVPATSAATPAVLGPLALSTAVSGPHQPVVGVPEIYEASIVDIDGNPTSYQWSVDGRRAGTAPELHYRFSTGGRHVVAVRVDDSAGNHLTAKVTVTATQRRLDVQVAWNDAFTPAWTKFTTLVAQSVPAGTTIELGCTGVGCPFHHHRLLIATHAARKGKKRGEGKKKPAAGRAQDVDLTGLLQHRQLSVGDTLTITFTLKYYAGQVQTFRIGAHGPLLTRRSLAPTAKKPHRG
jgi:glycine rich protein